MGKYYLKQMIFLVVYIKEDICVIKKISLKVGFNTNMVKVFMWIVYL